jgi:hypothetical protein
MAGDHSDHRQALGRQQARRDEMLLEVAHV